MNMSRNMPSERHRFLQELTLAERNLRVIQAIVLVLLAILLGYAACLIYRGDWKALFALLPPTTAACAALLIAQTATRLLSYNKMVREDDRARDVVRCIHHSMALIKNLQNYVQYMKLVLAEGNRPLAALTQSADAIQKRYEALYDRELYQFLPGEVSDAIDAMSGSMLGLSALVAGIASALDNKVHQMIPPDMSGNRTSAIQATEALGAELDALFSRFEAIRHSEE